MADREIRCSVVVPCRNGAKTLARQLAALQAQAAPVEFEIIVADNGSSDRSRAIAARLLGEGAVVDASRAPGINVARNCGLRRAKGELVLFCDADDVVHPNWISAYWDAYEHGARLLGGSLRRVSADGMAIARQDVMNDALNFLPWPTGANCGFARALVDDLGPFEEDLRGGGDETEFFWRAQLAGYALQLVPNAVVDYFARADLRSNVRQAYGFGRSHAMLYSRFRSRGMPRSRSLQNGSALIQLLLRMIRHRFAPAPSSDFLRWGAILAGRLHGSIHHRVFYV